MALASSEEDPFFCTYAQAQMAIAARTADLFRTAGFGKEAMLKHLEKFARRFSDRGADFASKQATDVNSMVRKRGGALRIVSSNGETR